MTILDAVQRAVKAVYGPAQPAELIKRLAAEVEVELRGAVGNAAPRHVSAPSDGGENRSTAILALCEAILGKFKPRAKGGGWTAYVNDTQMAEWREQAGGE